MNRIFYENVDMKILYDLLEQICLKTDKHYIVNVIAYKKMMFLKLHLPFLNTIVHAYHTSKQFYITRKLNFNSFITIVKQICNLNKHKVTSKIQYAESEYIINYFVPYHQTEAFGLCPPASASIVDTDPDAGMRSMDAEDPMRERRRRGLSGDDVVGLVPNTFVIP